MAQESSKMTLSRTSSEASGDLSSSESAANEIRTQIEQTRAVMAETIDEIQARMRPGRLVSDATERIKDATVDGVKTVAARSAELAAHARSSADVEAAFDIVKRNRVAAALLGAGAALLILRAQRRARNHRAQTQLQADRLPADDTSFKRKRNQFIWSVLAAAGGYACVNSLQKETRARTALEVDNLL
jgi:Protein of unknown function (DUF3618)